MTTFKLTPQGASSSGDDTFWTMEQHVGSRSMPWVGAVCLGITNHDAMSKYYHYFRTLYSCLPCYYSS
jgi:hypothetical protein